LFWKEDPLRLERILNVLILHIDDKKSIVFRKEWIEQLRALTCDDYGMFMRDTIYPALSVDDRKIWHKTTISNLDLQSAIQAFQ
jgi:hypothetical protein